MTKRPTPDEAEDYVIETSGGGGGEEDEDEYEFDSEGGSSHQSVDDHRWFLNHHAPYLDDELITDPLPVDHAEQYRIHLCVFTIESKGAHPFVKYLFEKDSVKNVMKLPTFDTDEAEDVEDEEEDVPAENGGGKERGSSHQSERVMAQARSMLEDLVIGSGGADLLRGRSREYRGYKTMNTDIEFFLFFEVGDDDGDGEFKDNAHAEPEPETTSSSSAAAAAPKQLSWLILHEIKYVRQKYGIPIDDVAVALFRYNAFLSVFRRKARIGDDDNDDDDSDNDEQHLVEPTLMYLCERVGGGDTNTFYSTVQTESHYDEMLRPSGLCPATWLADTRFEYFFSFDVLHQHSGGVSGDGSRGTAAAAAGMMLRSAGATVGAAGAAALAATSVEDEKAAAVAAEEAAAEAGRSPAAQVTEAVARRSRAFAVHLAEKTTTCVLSRDVADMDDAERKRVAAAIDRSAAAAVYFTEGRTALVALANMHHFVAV